MTWTPDRLDEREEVELRSIAAKVLQQVGPERYRQLVDGLLLEHQDEILRSPEDNPARIRLVELLARRKMGLQ